MKQNWRNWKLTNDILNSPVYRPYLKTAVSFNTRFLPFRAALNPASARNFHVYCVGSVKSGTTSIGNFLKGKYRTGHEAMPRESVVNTVAYHKNQLSGSAFINFIKHRDRYLNLELESSGFFLFWVDHLPKVFPEAKFILTIRDCYSWLHSMINQEFATNAHVKESYWRMLFDEYFDDEGHYEGYNKLLMDKGLHSIPAYLKYWNYHNQKVITSIPADKLLIIRTHEISQKTDEIADFLGIDSSIVAPSKLHQNRLKQEKVDLSGIPGAYIEKCVQLYCKDLMQTYFPEFT